MWTSIDCLSLTVHHFHSLCGRPEATDLFSYCTLLFGELNQIVCFQEFLLFDVKNATQPLLNM